MRVIFYSPHKYVGKFFTENKNVFCPAFCKITYYEVKGLQLTVYVKYFLYILYEKINIDMALHKHCAAVLHAKF